MTTAVRKKKVGASRTLSDSHKSQIEVLTYMYKSASHGTSGRQFEITEIADGTAVGDDKEVQRYLLILEGQKLVSPFPAGDFTSTRWQITPTGLKAVKMITKTLNEPENKSAA